MLKNLLTVFIFSVLFLPALAQKANIKGVVVDTVEKRNLSNSSILLINSKDSVLVRDTRAKGNGEFELANLKKGSYTLIITYPKMADYIRDIQLSDSSKFNLGTIAMDNKATLLNEVTIKAQKQAIRMKGDTITYQADSFAVKPHANLQDLLRRLPGIEVDKNGAIKAGGKDVNTLLVDGEEFFGDDPLLAQKYLKANAVNEVEVYDKKSKNEELTGIKEEDSKEKVINVKLKENAKNGYISTTEASSDLNKYRNLGAMAGVYKGKLKVAAFGFNNNISTESKTNNAMSRLKGDEYDVIEVGDDGSSVMISYGNNDDDDFRPGGGIPNITTYGAHFSNKWKDNKLGMKLNFKGADNSSFNESTSRNESLIPNGTTFLSQGASREENRTTGQSLRGSTEFKLDSLSNLKISFGGRQQHSSSSSFSNSETKNGRGIMVNSNNENGDSNGKSEAFNGNIGYVKKFKIKGRILTVDLQPENNRNNNERNSLNQTNLFDSTGVMLTPDRRNYLNDDQSSKTSLASRISYTEPLSKRLSLQAGYSFKTIRSSSKKYTYNRDLGNQKIDSLSNFFEFNNFSNVGNAILQYKGKKFTLRGGTQAIQTTFHLDDVDRNRQVNRSYINWAPETSLSYKLGRSGSISAGYRGSTDQPDIEQLQPLRQVNSPLYTLIGNPNLRPSFNNNFNLNINTYQQKSEIFAYSYLGYNFVQNAVASSTTVDQSNKTVTTFVNLNGGKSLYAGGSIGKSFSKIHLNTNMGFNYNYNQDVSILNKELNKTSRSSMSLRPRISIYHDKFSLEYNVSLNFSKSRSTIGTVNDGKNFRHDHEISGNINLPYSTEFNTSVSLSYQPANASFARPVNIAIWNAYLSKRMLKAEEMEIRASISDILGQRVGYNRYVNGNSIGESTNSFIPRYVLIGVVYNLNGNFVKNEKK